MASFIASTVAKGAFNLVAKDRNVLIPLDNISKTKVLTDEQLKEQFCKQGKQIKELEDTISKIKAAKDPKKLLSNLEKVISRF